MTKIIRRLKQTLQNIACVIFSGGPGPRGCLLTSGLEPSAKSPKPHPTIAAGRVGTTVTLGQQLLALQAQIATASRPFSNNPPTNWVTTCRTPARVDGIKLDDVYQNNISSRIGGIRLNRIIKCKTTIQLISLCPGPPANNTMSPPLPTDPTETSFPFTPELGHT